jgi:ribokinase
VRRARFNFSVKDFIACSNPFFLLVAGAGDCFTAAYTVAILEGMDTKVALRFASAAGSLCVQRAGAMPSMPNRADVQALLAAISEI